MPTTAVQLIPYNVLTATPDVCRDDKAIADRLEDILNAYEAASSTYTPSWTASSTNPSLGNGALTGRYKRLGSSGKQIHGSMRLTIGSTTTAGVGTYAFALPVTPHAEQGDIGTVVGAISGQWHTGRLLPAAGGAVNVIWNNGAAAAPAWEATAPFSTASGDAYYFRFSYEAA